VRDLGVRTGVLEYRPLVWTAERWSETYRSGAADGYGAVDEAARYGLLLGYLTWLGGSPTILDIGCGAGLLRDRLGTLGFASYVGIDPVPEAIAQAEERADERTSFVVGDPLDVDPGRFDVVICNEVLYMAERPFDLIERLDAFLHTGGHVLSSIWRHPGDVLLWRALDERYALIDRSSARSAGNRLARRGWVAACHRAKR